MKNRKHRRFYTSIWCALLFWCPGCFHHQETKEVAVSYSRPGIVLPAFAQSIALEVQSEAKPIVTKKAAHRFIVATIQEQYPHLVWSDPNEADILLRIHLGKILSQEREEEIESMEFEGNLAHRPIRRTTKQWQTRSTMAISFQVLVPKLQETLVHQSKTVSFGLPEEGYRIFADWFSEKWGLCFYSKKIVLPRGAGEPKIEASLKAGKIEEAISRITSSLDFLFSIGRKRLLSQEEAYECAVLCEARAALLEISGRTKAAHRDQKRAAFLLQELGHTTQKKLW